MTCQSCVKNIEETIGKRPEVVYIKVVLEEKVGYIEYKTQEVAPHVLAEAIEEMGFTCSIAEDQTTNPLIPVTCNLLVDGITCQSCVTNIIGESIY